MKMSNKESGNATLQGSTRGGDVTARERRVERRELRGNRYELKETEQETESRRKSSFEAVRGG